MDVVKTNIEKIGGTIDLKSVPGAGTTFTIKIPLTLAIVSALIVEAGGERFAIPQISVVELVRARKDGSRGHNEGGSESVIERINDTPVLRLRDRLLPLVNLNDLLALGESHNDDTGAYIVVAQVGRQQLGIIVDRVFDTEEIVVKPVAPILRHVTMFSGNTILGDGSVIMILDPNGIARAHRHRRRRRQQGGVVERDRYACALDRPHGDAAVPRRRRAEAWRCRSGLVARLEDIPRDKIEISCGSPVTQYRGKLMPLVALSDNLDSEKPRQSGAGVHRRRPQHGPDGRRDRRRGGGPAGHRAVGRAARTAGHRGDRRPRHRRDRHRLLADAGLAGLVPRRARNRRTAIRRAACWWWRTATSSASW